MRVSHNTHRWSRWSIHYSTSRLMSELKHFLPATNGYRSTTCDVIAIKVGGTNFSLASALSSLVSWLRPFVENPKNPKKNNYFLIPKESWRNGGLDGATPNCTAAHQHRNKQINQTAAAALKYQQEPRRNAELRQQFIGQNWTTGRHRQFQLFASPKSRETVRVTAPLTIT